MKLSKVKGVCAGTGHIFHIKAETGFDVQSWIGDGAALYPIRSLDITAEKARIIWELDEEKVSCREGDMDLILAKQLAGVPVQIDAENAPTKEICEINGWKVLWDETTQQSRLINVRFLAPVEAKNRAYLYMEEEGWVAVYEEGVIAAVVVPMKWQSILEEPMQKLGLIYARERVSP